MLPQALRAHGRDSPVAAEEGLRAIRNLTATNETNKRSLGERSVCDGKLPAAACVTGRQLRQTQLRLLCCRPVLLQALDAHVRESRDVAEAGAWALMDLAQNDAENIRVLGEAGGCAGMLHPSMLSHI